MPSGPALAQKHPCQKKSASTLLSVSRAYAGFQLRQVQTAATAENEQGTVWAPGAGSSPRHNPPACSRPRGPRCVAHRDMGRGMALIQRPRVSCSNPLF